MGQELSHSLSEKSQIFRWSRPRTSFHLNRAVETSWIILSYQFDLSNEWYRLQQIPTRQDFPAQSHRALKIECLNSMFKFRLSTSRRWFPRRIARRSCWRDWLVWFMRRCFEWISLLSWVEIALEAKMCNFDEMRAHYLECDICHLLDRGTRYWRLLLIKLLHYRSEGFGTLSWIFNYQQHFYAYLFVKSDQGLDKMAQLRNLLDIITKKG